MGKDDHNEFMKTEEGQEKDKYDLKNNNSWMDEIEDYKKGKKKKESSQRFSRGFGPKNPTSCSKRFTPNHLPTAFVETASMLLLYSDP